MRRLVTYFVYQFPCFGQGDAEQLRDILQKSKKVYFSGLERGFDALYPQSIRDLIGSDYDRLEGRLSDAGRYRNKIFHGQLTSEYLSRQELVGYVCDIRSWCKALASAALTELQYDGLGRNSFRKCTIMDFHKRLKIQFVSASSYEAFISCHMEGKQSHTCKCGQHPPALNQSLQVSRKSKSAKRTLTSHAAEANKPIALSRPSRTPDPR
jgi:hypothetical protein